MSDIEMKILAVVVDNADFPKQIMSAVSEAFPNETEKLLKGYIYEFRKKGYVSLLEGDNGINSVHVNPSAYRALREHKDAPDEKFTPQFNIGTIHGGQFAMGNKGGSYNMSLSKTVVHEMSSGLKNVLEMSDRRMTDELEREQLKYLVNKIVESLDKSEPPPQSLIEKLDSFMQRHSWISAPLAAAFLNTLSKLFH